MSENCPVCQDMFKNPKLLHCGHTFCRKCIDGIIESERTGDINCPLCRKITKRPKNGAKDLMDNFYTSDRRCSTKVFRCKECDIISLNKTCEFCGIHLCENCLFSHMEITCGKQVTQPLVHSVTYGSNIDGVYSENYITSLEGQLMSENFQSNFCFDIDKRIVVPNLFRSDAYGMNISLSSISCFDGSHCIVAPNGEQVVLIYDEYGNEISRAFINIRIYSIAGGILGHPLMIENGTSMIYEYSNGAIRQLFWSQPLLPFDLASLNDGRIVLVGTMKVRSLQGLDIETQGAMRIYQQNGLLCNEVAKENGEPRFNFPRQVCVNLHNNDIYVGDIRKMQVMRFREDCTFVSLYRRREMESIDFGNGVTSEFIIRSSNFPLALAYSQRGHLLFASYVSAIDRGIHILSTCLELLGIFSSNEELGNPVGMSCDKSGRLYVGDAADGIIRVFKLSQFINRL